jgi:hypothetical protein
MTEQRPFKRRSTVHKEQAEALARSREEAKAAGPPVPKAEVVGPASPLDGAYLKAMVAAARKKGHDALQAKCPAAPQTDLNLALGLLTVGQSVQHALALVIAHLLEQEAARNG